MPKAKKVTAEQKKKLNLTPLQRSQVAKDRWAKRRANEAAEKIVVTVNTMLEQDAAKDAPAPPQPPEQPPVTPESFTGNPVLQAAGMHIQVETDGGKTLAAAPQPALVPPKKQKRIPVPKEFLTALKTADSLLAKAIEEYEDCQRRITYLSGSIPRLQRTVLALRNESNPDAPVPLPNAFNYNAPTAFQASPNPNFQPHNPLAAIQAAMDAAQVALPVSRAVGGVQLSPDVIGSLEDDDDEDRFITGAGEKGWIGG